ncbi:HCP-like protein, partial [Neoconidiobolus thromboides FSU 785]
SLSGNDDLLNVYRENAKKTNDPKVQLEFGKFLLESSVNLLNKDLPTYDEESSQKLEKEGIFWIKKLQKLNNPEAVYIVGTWNEKGMYGYSPSSSRSNTLYLSSAKLGYPPAIDKVGFHYEKKKDFTRAVAYYKKAAALADPSANYRLGIAYIYGELKLGVNHKNAQFYLRRSASEANQYCPQGAYIWALILFGLYEEDLGIRDDVEGRDYLIKAADLNYLPAQYKLGYCYEYGEYNLQVDPMLSIDYYRRAAQGGHPEAQVALSGWYLTGAPGVLDQSDELAFQWCSKASSQGFPKAEYAMGQYYEMGVGVEISLQNALGWYKKAASNGFEKAKERL